MMAPRVLIIGVGHTAMDCCRTSKRIGGTDVKVVARNSRPYFKASPWELEDAEEERIDIVEDHSPSRFVLEDGRLVGMEFDVVEWVQHVFRFDALRVPLSQPKVGVNELQIHIRAAEIDLHFSVVRSRGVKRRAGGKKGTVTKKGTYILK